MIIGLSGKNASGKGVVAEFLKSKGFYFFSLSDVIREEIRERGEEITRQRLIEVGNELRSKHGPITWRAGFWSASKKTETMWLTLSAILMRWRLFAAGRTFIS